LRQFPLTIAYDPVAALVRRNADMFQPGKNKVSDILPGWEEVTSFEALGNYPIGHHVLDAGIYFLSLNIIQNFY
jgi:hypothetical protein